MKRVLVAMTMFGLMTGPMVGQGAASKINEIPERPELLRRIGVYEAAVRHAEQAKALNAKLVSVYMDLGGLYEAAAMYPRAEEAMGRALQLIRSGVPGELAPAIVDMATLHVEMGAFRQAEKEEMEAMKLREAAGDRAGVAQNWSRLAVVYLKMKKYDKAVEYGRKAMDLLGDEEGVNTIDRIAVRQALANSFCALHDCKRGIPLLRDAVDIAKRAYGEGSTPAALGHYLLGFTCWKAGDREGAAAMAKGIEEMKATLGWGHPAYVAMLKNYAVFLREGGQMELAGLAEREVRQAESVVDVRSFARVSPAR